MADRIHRTSLGFNLFVTWPSDTLNNSHLVRSERIAGTAFADDMNWIASNKQDAYEIINISKELFDITDINING